MRYSPINEPAWRWKPERGNIEWHEPRPKVNWNSNSSLAPLPTDAPGQERKGGRIERAAQRDPVGDQIPTTTTSKCSFSRVLEIPVQRFLDSGTQRVECPDCHALRAITPRNGMLRYPPHDRRKTRTPQVEPR